MSQKITPVLWFKGVGQEAMDFYQSVFKENFKSVITSHYPTEGLEDFQKPLAGQPLTIDFELFGNKYMALNAGSEFTFNESVSFMISCKDQDEIDYYWDALIADGGNESQCGWLKDRFGFSWQIIPENMAELMQSPDAFPKLMNMKRIVIGNFGDA